MAALSGISEIFRGIPQCQGKDDWAHRLFLTTNENHQEAFEKLTRQPVTGNTLVGTSGLCLLNIAALRGIRAAENPETIQQIILIDRSLRMEHFWGKAQEIITRSPDRKAALEAIKALVRENQKYYFNGLIEETQDSAILSRFSPEKLFGKMTAATLNYVDSEVASGGSCFSSDASYAKIKKIFDANQFLFLRLDFEDSTTMSLLAQRLQENRFTTDLIYLSNVAEYVEKDVPARLVADKRTSYVATLDKLSQKGTLFLQCTPRKCFGCEPNLQLSLTRKSVRPLAIRDIFPYSEPVDLCPTCTLRS